MRKKNDSIRFPVSYDGQNWKLLNGSNIPVKKGTYGELILSSSVINSQTLVNAINCEKRIKIFDEGDKLLVGLLLKDDNDKIHNKYLKNIGKANISVNYKGSHSSSFFEIEIGSPNQSQTHQGHKEGGLWFIMKGFHVTGIDVSSIIIPNFPEKIPQSLNHAFTILSEIYEPWRISHTGNIYDKILYKSDKGIWYPLSEFRNKIETDEKMIIP